MPITYKTGILLAFCVLFAGVVGAPVIYMTLIAWILVAAWSLFRRQGLWIVSERSSELFALAFLLFAAGFLMSAEEPRDGIFAFNYLPLLLFAPLAAFLARGAAPANAYRLAWIALAGTAIIFLSASIQVFGLNIARAQGYQVDPIAMGQTAVMLGFLAATGVLSSGDTKRFILLAGPVLGVGAALLTGSRGPVLVAAPLALIVLIYVTRRPLLSLLGVIGASIVGTFLLWLIWPTAFARLETLYDIAQGLFVDGAVEEYSAGRRIDMYRGAFLAFWDSPWFGHGWENKFPAVAPYLPSYWVGFEGHHHLHADLADTAVASGLIGLVGYALIIAAPVIGSILSPADGQYRQRRYLALILATGYFGFGLTYLLFGYEYHTTLYTILAAAIIGYCRDSVPPLQGRKRATPER